ncbi:MAG: hypothetical protein ACXW2E_12595 [Nitrososphaeraceae archaeon]
MESSLECLEITFVDIILFAVSIARIKNIKDSSADVKKIISYENADGKE